MTTLRRSTRVVPVARSGDRPQRMRETGHNADGTHSMPDVLTTHHSPLTTRHSPLTTHHSPLTTHHSPLTDSPAQRLTDRGTPAAWSSRRPFSRAWLACRS